MLIKRRNLSAKYEQVAGALPKPEVSKKVTKRKVNARWFVGATNIEIADTHPISSIGVTCDPIHTN